MAWTRVGGVKPMRSNREEKAETEVAETADGNRSSHGFGELQLEPPRSRRACDTATVRTELQPPGSRPAGEPHGCGDREIMAPELKADL